MEGSTFGSLLRQMRERAGLRQHKLAAKAGGELGQPHISRLEAGERSPSRRVVMRIADALQATPDQRDVLLMAAGLAPGDPIRMADLLEQAARLVDPDRPTPSVRYVRATIRIESPDELSDEEARAAANALDELAKVAVLKRQIGPNSVEWVKVTAAVVVHGAFEDDEGDAEPLEPDLSDDFPMALEYSDPYEEMMADHAAAEYAQYEAAAFGREE